MARLRMLLAEMLYNVAPPANCCCLCCSTTSSIDRARLTDRQALMVAAGNTANEAHRAALELSFRQTKMLPFGESTPCGKKMRRMKGVVFAHVSSAIFSSGN